MQFKLLTRLVVLLLVVIVVTPRATVAAADDFSALALVSNDAAFCVQVPHLSETWTMFENGPLMDRLRAIPAYQRLRESRGFQQWQTIDDHVARQTGQKLSVQLRALLGRSLVLAVYVPAEGPPRGILIGEAIDRPAIETAMDTWNKLEPNQVIVPKTHGGVRYQERLKHANAPQSTFVVTFDRWFAVSDQESLIRDVIDRFSMATGSGSTSVASESLGDSKSFVQNMQRLTSGGAAYLFINARPWDRGLEDASRDERGSINPAVIWKHVSAVSACLQLDRGLVCDAVVELESSRLPSGWSQFVATAATNSEWTRRIPPDALLAICGHLDLAPFLRYFVSQIPPRDQAELAKNRRIVQSLLGGHELLDAVLPALGRDFSGSIVARKDDRSKRVVLDGAIGFALSGPGDSKLLQDLAPGLNTGLTVLAAFFSAEGPSIVTVEREQTESTQLSWLSASAPFPIAFGLEGDNLLIAGSPERLRRAFDALDWRRHHIELLRRAFEHDGSHARLTEHSERFFPKANQLIWFDTAVTRELLQQSGSDIAEFFAHGSAEESSRFVNRFEQARPVLGLVDSLFIAGRIESDHIRVTFGGGLDAK